MKKMKKNERIERIEGPRTLKKMKEMKEMKQLKQLRAPTPSTLHSPTFSAGIRRTHRNPADLTGLQKCHILSHGGSAGVRWSPLE